MVTLEQLDKHNYKVYIELRQRNFSNGITIVTIIDLETLEAINTSNLKLDVLYALWSEVWSFACKDEYLWIKIKALVSAKNPKMERIEALKDELMFYWFWKKYDGCLKK